MSEDSDSNLAKKSKRTYSVAQSNAKLEKSVFEITKIMTSLKKFISGEDQEINLDLFIFL